MRRFPRATNLFGALLLLAVAACSKDKEAADKKEGASQKTGCGSVEDCQKGCDKDKADDCLALGDLLLDKPRKESDDATTKKAFDAACEGGLQHGCVMAAMLLRRTTTKLSDAVKAAKVYEKACDKGEPSGCLLLAMTLEGAIVEGKPVLETDLPRARKLLGKACDDGYAPACTELGGTFDGLAADADEKRAYQLYKKACAKGCQRGCTRQGHALLIGAGVDEDLAKGLELTEKACKKGRPDFPDYAAVACDTLGQAYGDGKYGATKSAKSAAIYYTRACNMGLESACDKGKAHAKGKDD